MMQSWASVFFLVLFATKACEASSANPLGEVISLLDSLTAKIMKESEADAKAYKEYFAWCDDATSNKGFEIKSATSAKEALEASIAKESSVAADATSKIEELAASIAADEDELKKATSIRTKEAADFSSEESELVDVVNTLDRALAVVEREMAKNPAAFAQVDSSNLDNFLRSLGTVVQAAAFTSNDRKSLVALVQQSADAGDDDVGAPAAAVYKTHSTGVVDVLEDLKEKAEEQLATLRKTESSASHNYQMLKQSLEDQVGADTKSMTAEKETKAAAEEKKAVAQSDLAETATDLADAKAVLSTLKRDCMQTAADHGASTAARTEELKVLAQAKSMLESTSAGAVAQTYSLFQVVASSRFRTHADLANNEVVTMVKRLAKEQHSAELAQLASRIASVIKYGASAGEDPFTKVKGLLSQLISKLEAEAESDTSEKAYCDEQLQKTEAKKGELEYDIDKLSTKIDQSAAASAKLKEDVKAVQGELAALAKSQAEMDMIRAESHASYVKAKEDLETGLAGVRNALGMLRDYYGSSSSASALLQNDKEDSSLIALLQQPEVPEFHSKATGAGTSVIGILEVIESDFAKSLATEETEEADAAAEYERLTQDNAVTKTLQEQDVKYKTAEYKALDKQLTVLTGDRDTKDAELSAVMEYYGKIKDRCIAKAETYDLRKERREAEIKGLKAALEVLESETALVQRKRHGLSKAFLATGLN
jgi:chaperonin cofactor prefoldin